MNLETHLDWDPIAARTAGALYLIIAVCGGFSIGYVPMQIVAGDAATSSANLLANQGLFRLGVAADIAVIVLEIAITATLYKLFRSTGSASATVMLIARLGMAIVMGINLLFWIAPYILLTASSDLDVITKQGIVQLCFEIHAMGVFVWQLFFGAHLLALGWLALNSNRVPKFLGFGLFIGAFGYLGQGVVELTFIDVLLLDYSIIALLVVVTLSEISFGLWLLIRG